MPVLDSSYYIIHCTLVYLHFIVSHYATPTYATCLLHLTYPVYLTCSFTFVFIGCVL